MLSHANVAAACTSIAYVLFYRLMSRIGATKSMAVLYLIPVFGVLWGLVFLHEPVTPAMAGGCTIILLGVALTTGLVRLRPFTAKVAAVEEA